MADKKILLVDDEVKILEIFSKQLINLGHFSVDTAQGGIMATEKLKSGKYDLVLLDLMMPDKDGVEVLSDIKILDPKPQVVILTNLISEEQKLLTSNLGAVDYIIKTEIDPKTLIAKINNIFNPTTSQ